MEEMVKVLRDEYNVNAMEKTRKEAVVIPRAALFNVCRGYYSATQIGQFFEKNHATILHHFKNHESFMMLPQYVEIYERLMEVLAEYDDRARHAKKERELRKEQIHELTEQVDELQCENESLREKLNAYAWKDNPKKASQNVCRPLHRGIAMGFIEHDVGGQRDAMERRRCEPTEQQRAID